MLETYALSKWAASIYKKHSSDSFSVMFLLQMLKNTEMFVKLVFRKIILIFTLAKTMFPFQFLPFFLFQKSTFLYKPEGNCK